MHKLEELSYSKFKIVQTKCNEKISKKYSNAIRCYYKYRRFLASEINLFSLKGEFNAEEVKQMLPKINMRSYRGTIICVNNLIYLENEHKLLIHRIEDPTRVESPVLIRYMLGIKYLCRTFNLSVKELNEKL